MRELERKDKDSPQIQQTVFRPLRDDETPLAGGPNVFVRFACFQLYTEPNFSAWNEKSNDSKEGS